MSQPAKMLCTIRADRVASEVERPEVRKSRNLRCSIGADLVAPEMQRHQMREIAQVHRDDVDIRDHIHVHDAMVGPALPEQCFAPLRLIVVTASSRTCTVRTYTIWTQKCKMCPLFFSRAADRVAHNALDMLFLYLFAACVSHRVR